MTYDVIIIGGGISAFSAAMYSARFKLKTLVIGEKIGGTVILAGDMFNFPGFEKISGIELFERIKQHAQKYGIDIAEKKVEKVAGAPEAVQAPEEGPKEE